MIVDPQTLAARQQLDCDICIVGSGAAGMSIARELDGSGLTVVLLEAGSMSYDASLQEQLRGQVDAASPHSAPAMYRRRMLGGTTTIWGGRCVPLSPIDLETRDYVPHSGWPISWGELEQYYPKALNYCEAGAYAFDVADVLGGEAPAFIDGFADPALDTTLERFSPPTNFGQTYRTVITASSNISVILMSRAVRLEEDGSRIVCLEAETKARHSFTVKATQYVLAMGGMETPRFLMSSDESRRGGIGNETGNLGRYYMCHIENTLGQLELTPSTRSASIYFENSVDRIYVRRKIEIAASAQLENRVLNTAARLHHPTIADPSHRNGVLSAMYLVKDTILPEYRRKIAAIELAKRDMLKRDVRFWAAHVANVGLDSVGVMRFGIDWLRRRTLARRKLPFVALKSRVGIYPLDVNAEQVPDASNRLTLGDERNSDGLQQVKVHWRLMDQDIDSLVRSMAVLRDSFARSRCAILNYDEQTIVDQIRASSPIGGHHIGTMRMADDPVDGVVDRHGRVHGYDNLHVAGAATFPTCGHANPTLTIVALALRLAQRLRQTTGSATNTSPSAGHT